MAKWQLAYSVKELARAYAWVEMLQPAVSPGIVQRNRLRQNSWLDVRLQGDWYVAA